MNTTTKKLQSFTKKQWAQAKKENSYKMISIAELGDNEPVLAVQAFAGKSLAEFHLVNVVLVPNIK